MTFCSSSSESPGRETSLRSWASDPSDKPDFEAVITLATRIFQVSTVLIVLADERCHGSGFHCHPTQSESLGAWAVRANTVLKDGPSIVPDAVLDPRFADDPLVVGTPHLRFYASTPLITRDGATLGALCLVDTEPRTFDVGEIATLAQCGAMAMKSVDAWQTGRRLRQEVALHEETNRALRQVEARYRRIIQHTPSVVYQFVRRADGQGEFTFVSDACRKLLGLEPEALQRDANRYFDLVHPDDRANRDQMVADSVKKMEPLHWEGRHRLPSGWIWLQVSSRPERAANGDIVWDGVIFDVTDRHRAQEEATQAARRVHTVLESITDAFYSLDRQWRFTYVNEQAQRVLERPRSELLGRSLWEVFPYKAKMAYHPEFHRALETNHPAVFELYSAPLKKWLGVHAYPSEEGLSVYVQNITERKQAQKALEDNLGLLQAIIDGTDNHIFIRNLDGRYLLINPAGAAMLGTTPEAAVGKDDHAFFLPESIESNRASDEAVMRSGESMTYESSDIIHGVEHFFQSTKSPYRDASGKLLGFIGIAREVTEQRRAAAALRQAKEDAERANAAKNEFLSRMSHELRTPLNSILGFGQLLLMDDLQESQLESVQHVVSGGRHLLKLIDEVLDIARVESGRIEMTLEAVGLAGLVRESLSLMAPLAAARGITLDARTILGDPAGRMDEADRWVLADHQRLRQVLLNLLANAIKYNAPAGRVILDYAVAAPGRLRLRVKDTGPGIPESKRARLFVPFDRLDAEQSGVQGTGLGLALSKSLLEAMDGTISCEGSEAPSSPACDDVGGAVFWIELPAVLNPPGRASGVQTIRTSETVDRQPRPGRQTLLYIEDNLTNMNLMQRLVSRHLGVRMLSAMQGSLGLDLAREHRPDLILLDVHLPDLSGAEVLAQLRADAATRDIPVIAVSADATERQTELFYRAGVHTYLTKPLDVRMFLATVRDLLALDHQPVLAAGAA